MLPQRLRVYQNNKALKPSVLRHKFYRCLRVYQNNKALKRTIFVLKIFAGLRVYQNNKALKPQMRSKAHAAARLFLILVIF